MNRFPWRSLIAGFILLLLLTGSGCSTAVPPTTTPAPSATLPADSSAAGRQSDWRPFHFQPGQEFTYAIRYQPAGQAEQSGTFVLNVTEAGAGKVKADWQGSLGSEHFAASTIAAPDQIAPNMLTGMVRNPAAAPVYFTLFHPWMGMGIWALALGSGNLEVGSKWSDSQWSFLCFRSRGKAQLRWR